MAIDPRPFSGDSFAERLEVLIAAIEGQEGARLPGSRRLEARARAAREGLAVPAALLAEIRALAD